MVFAFSVLLRDRPDDDVDFVSRHVPCHDRAFVYAHSKGNFPFKGSF